MSSADFCAALLRLRRTFEITLIAATALVIEAVPARAVLTGAPIATNGQVRFEVVPVGANTGAATFSSILSAPFTPTDGKLYYETNSVGSGGFSGYPTLGAPAIVGGAGPGPLPVAAALPATGAFGGGTMMMTTGLNSLAFTPGVADAGPNGFASASVGFAQATWINTSAVAGGTDTLPVVIPFAEMVVVPPGALYEVSLAGRILYPGGPTYALVAGIDNTGVRGPAFMNGGVSGDPNAPISGIGGGFSTFTFNVIQTASNAYMIAGFGVFTTTPIADGAAVQLNGTLTAAMDPGNGSFVRAAPYPKGAPVFGAEGITISAAEAPSFSSEWTNAGGTHDFNSPSNFSNGAPPATGEAFLADGPTTPDGKTISATGRHVLHLLTVANSTAPNYTIGLTTHEGSFDFGGNGGIEVYSGGATVNNCDVLSAAQLNFRVADPTTVLKQLGDVSAPFITVDGLGTLQFFSPSVSFNGLTANLGTTEFMVPVSTSGNISIGSGATVKFDGAGSLLGGPGAIAITAGGTLAFSGGSIAAAVTNSGTIHLAPGGPSLITGALTNSGTILLDPGVMGAISLPYSSSAGAITNYGTLNFNSTFSGAIGIGGTGLSVFNGQVSTGTGAASTANLNIAGNGIINNELFLRLTGSARGSKYDALTVGGNLSLGGTLHMELDGGFSPTAGNSFDLLDWGSLSGKFNTLNLPPLAPGLAWSSLHLYDTGVLSVANSKALPADFNHDVHITAGDISTMLGALADLNSYKSASQLTDADLLSIGDINGDGKVTNGDVNALIGLLRTGGGSSGSLASVPEPGSLVPLATGGLFMLWRRTRGPRARSSRA